MRWSGTKKAGKNERIQIKRSYIYHDKVMITCHWSLREIHTDGSLGNPIFSLEDRVSELYVKKYIRKIEKNILPEQIKKVANKIGEEL